MIGTLVFSLLIGQDSSEASRLYKQAIGSVATVITRNFDGSSSQGTAFVWDATGIAATAWHVVDGAQSVTLRFSDNSVANSDGIIDVDKNADLALIRIPATSRAPLKPVTERPSVGTRIYCLGTPEGLEFSITDGIVSAYRDFGGARLLQVSCPVSHGNSGGPILLSNGEVAGIVRSTLADAQNLNFAVDAAHLRLLDKTKPTLSWISLSPVSQVAEQLDAKDLRAMISGLGFEIKTLNSELGKEKYEFTVKNDAFDIPIAAEISASKNYVWLTVYLGKAPADDSPKMAGFVKRNFKIQPCMFYITDKGNLMMGFAMENRGLTPAVMRRTINKLQEDVTSTADLWAEGGPQAQE